MRNPLWSSLGNEWLVLVQMAGDTYVKWRHLHKVELLTKGMKNQKKIMLEQPCLKMDRNENKK